MLWAKLWTDVLADPKLLRAARKGALRLELLPWLFAFAKQAGDNGRLTVNGEAAEPIDISAQIPGMKPRDVTVCCVHLYELKILTRDDDGAYRFVNWKKRQGASPSDAPSAVALRVQKHRAKKRGVTALQVVSGNGTEQEQEIEQEQEEEEAVTPLPPPPSSKRFRDQLLDQLSRTRRVGMEAAIRTWETGHDLPAVVSGKIPTPAQIDAACRDVMASCEIGEWTVRTVRGFLAKAMGADAEVVLPRRFSGHRSGAPERAMPPRGGSPPPADPDVRCAACGTKEMHELNGRSVPKHRDGCPIQLTAAKLGGAA